MTNDAIIGLEIGTTKTVFMVAEPREDGGLTVRALISHPTAGVRKGQVVDYESAQTCVREAWHTVETQLKLSETRVTLALTGPHIQTMRHRGQLPIPDRHHEITEQDVAHVKKVAAAISLSDDRRVLHRIYGRYEVDDDHRVLWPVGMEGTLLSVEVLVIHGQLLPFRNLVKLLDDTGLELGSPVFGGYAAAKAVLRPEHKRSGVVVLDLGGGTTDYLAYAGEAVAAAGVLGVGGDHVTSDLCHAFGLTRIEADDLKHEHGAALPERTTKAIVLPSAFSRRERTIPVASLRTVIHARMEETFELIRNRLDAEGVLAQVGGGILLTGGGARLRDVAVVAEKVFGKPCVVAAPWGLSGQGMADRPELATVAGLVRFGMRQGADTERRPSVIDWLRSWWGGDEGEWDDDDLDH